MVRFYVIGVLIVRRRGHRARRHHRRPGLVAPGRWSRWCCSWSAIHDVVQTKHSILRNYPVLGHMRFLMEDIRPELQQYFIERNFDGRPYDRNTRTSIYQRAKGVKEEHPFGTERDVYATGYEYLVHSTAPVPTMEEPPRVRVGGPDCTQPYDMALLNVERHELRLARRPTPSRPSTGARRRRLRPRHRGGGDQPLPPPRWRPGLGDRVRLLRLPDRRRRLRRGGVRRQGGGPAGQDGPPQAQPGRQARYRRGAARVPR